MRDVVVVGQEWAAAKANCVNSGSLTGCTLRVLAQGQRGDARQPEPGPPVRCLQRRSDGLGLVELVLDARHPPISSAWSSCSSRASFLFMTAMIAAVQRSRLASARRREQYQMRASVVVCSVSVCARCAGEPRLSCLSVRLVAMIARWWTGTASIRMRRKADRSTNRNEPFSVRAGGAARNGQDPLPMSIRWRSGLGHKRVACCTAHVARLSFVTILHLTAPSPGDRSAIGTMEVCFM